MRKKYDRLEILIDIIFALLGIFLGACVVVWFFYQSANDLTRWGDFFINGALLVLAMLLEGGNLSRPLAEKQEVRDRGILSAIFTVSGLVVFPLLSYFVFDLLVTIHREFWIIGVLLLATGIALRFVASRTLGLFFNHALVIQREHRLIDVGIYRYVRHPAYLGTLLMILGSSWAFYTHVGVFVVLAGFIFALRRIRCEEGMLKNEFGREYLEYKNRTAALIPWIY